ncbi:apolipoprotein A-V [Tiliqua scincoides]|uniref:apolipoprotein A-V n=1 Tax=Tiliqua scincoides TaxID=71010 RepID=UPI003462B1CF
MVAAVFFHGLRRGGSASAVSPTPQSLPLQNLFYYISQRAGPGIIMRPQTALLTLLLAAFSAPQASPLQRSSWDYFSQLTQDKDHVRPAQQLKHGQEMRDLKGSFQDGTNYVGGVLQKLTSLDSGAQSRFYQDVNGLRQLIQGEIESLRLKLSSYTDEGHPEVSEKLGNLRRRLILLAEKLTDQVSLQARELQQHLRSSLSMMAQRSRNAEKTQQFAIQYAEEIALHTDQAKEIFQPYVDRLVAEIQHSFEELHKDIVPEQANQYIQEFSNGLTQNARDLHLKIQRRLEHLKGQLSLHSSHVLSPQQAPQQALDLCLEDLTKEVQERIEEFRRDTVLQIDHFTRTIDGEVEDMKLKLRSLPSYLEEFQENSTPLEDVHVRLDSLWRAISQSLGSPRGSID